MSIYKIIVDKTALDLPDDVTIALTLKAADIGSVQSRYANFTNQFKIPSTATNDLVLGFARLVQSQSIIPYSRLSNVRLLMAGIEILTSASLFIVNFTDNDYTIQVVADLNTFINLLGTREISQLDLALTGAWTSAAIDGYRNATSGVMAPLMQYGKLTIPIDVVAPYYLPSLAITDIINGIVNKNGYTLAATDALDTALGIDTHLTGLALAYSRDKYEYAPTFASRRQFSAKAAADRTIVWPAAGNPQFLAFDDLATYLSQVGELAAPVWNGSNWTPASTAYDWYADIYVVIDVDYTWTSGAGLAIFLRDGAATLASAGGVAATGTYQFQLTSLATSMGGASHNIYLEVDNTGTATATFKATCSWKVVISRKPQNNYLFSALLPDIAQSDFFREYLVRFGFLAKEKNKTISLKSIESIINDRANARNWTGKRNPNKRDVITFLNSSYAQNNRYKNQAQDEYPEGYGDGNLTVANTQLAQEKTAYESLFSSAVSYLQAIAGHDPISLVNIPVYDSTSADAYTFNVAPPAGIKMIRTRGRVATDPTVKYNGTTRTDFQVAYFDALNWGAYRADWPNFLDRYYPSLKLALQTMRIITREYNLDSVDVATFDFFFPIFDTDAYYLVNQIKNFIPGKMTQVELIKLP